MGKTLIEQAKQHALNSSVVLQLDYSKLETPRADVRQYLGQSGELSVEKYIIETIKQKQEFLLVSACTDSGQEMEFTTARRLLLVPGQACETDETLSQQALLQQGLHTLEGKHFAEAESINEQYYEEEVEKLENWGADRRVALDIRIRQLDLEITDARRAARQLPSLQEKIQAKRDLKKLERERDNTMLNYHEEKKKIELKEDELLEEVAEALEMTARTEPLFSLRWTLKEHV